MWLTNFSLGTATESPGMKTEERLSLEGGAVMGKACRTGMFYLTEEADGPCSCQYIRLGMRCYPVFHTRPPSRTLLIPASSILAPLLLASSNSFTIPVTSSFRILPSAFANISPTPGAHNAGDDTRHNTRV